MDKVAVIGGGAAGIFAAIGAGQLGAPVILVEKNKKLGMKLQITGKGRCNLTNSANLDVFLKNIPGNGKFLYSALHTFSNTHLLELLTQIGIPTKEEQGGRIFPVSDSAKEVVHNLTNYLKKLNVELWLNQKVDQIKVQDGRVTGFMVGEKFYAVPAVIIATGGASYPKTGSTGDGYRFAQELGHDVRPLKPSLIPLEVKEEWAKELTGLSLRNVRITAFDENNRKVAEKLGEMLFTHFGVSGPSILTLSRALVPKIETGEIIKLEINLKPALSVETLDARVQRDLNKFARKKLKNSLGDLLPKALIDPIIHLSGIAGDKFCHQVTREERKKLVNLLQHLPLTVIGFRPLAEAIVTAGGVNVKEINPTTMESKLVKGLYFAGEVIDVDGYTGGYNLQAAFSTGFVAGRSAAKQLGYS